MKYQSLSLDDRATYRRVDDVPRGEVGAGSVAPRAFSSSVKLSDCMPSEKPETKNRPDMLLPPCFGTMFTVRPAVSASPSPPDVVIVTSCALPMSAVKFGGWFPPGGLLMFKPSTVTRDSTPRPPWIGKIGEHRTGADVVHVGLQPWNCGQQVAVAADARQRAHRFVVERDLPLRALNIDDRGFAGDGDRLLDAADTQLTIDRDDSAPADDDTITPQVDEPRQGEGDRLSAGPKVFNAVPTVAIGHRRADLSISAGLAASTVTPAARRRTYLSRGRRGCLRPRRRLHGEEALRALRTLVHTHASVNSPFGCSRAQGRPANPT